jgi:DDE superfamily endonuclease
MVVVADSGYSALDFLHACQHIPNPITIITRLRLDAALYEPAPPRKTGQMGRPRLKGKRLPTLAEQGDDPKTVWQSTTIIWYQGQEKNVQVASGIAVWYHTGKLPVALRWVLITDPKGEFDTQALLSTNLDLEPGQIIAWFMLRCCLEVTFQEVRLHLGVETQKQWSSLAIFRTTPILFGLFSIVALAADNLYQHEGFSPRCTAWYLKPLPTFSDALATLRERLWHTSELFDTSSSDHASKQIPALLLDRLVETLCYAA